MSPVKVSILNVSLVPSVTLKSTSVPPLNTKFPAPLVPKFRGTSTSVPSVPIVVFASINRLAVTVPKEVFSVAVSTLKYGFTSDIEESAENPVNLRPVESNLPT